MNPIETGSTLLCNYILEPPISIIIHVLTRKYFFASEFLENLSRRNVSSGLHAYCMMM